MEYNERAIKLLNTRIGGNIAGFTDDEGRVWRYNRQTRDFGKCRPDGIIITWERVVYKHAPNPLAVLNGEASEKQPILELESLAQ
jgi:hypothetical protein